MKWWIVTVGLAMLSLAACSDGEPQRLVETGAEVLRETFDEAGPWEIAQHPTSSLLLADGRYRIDHQAERSASFIWGTGDHVDSASVIIELDTEQLSTYADTLYGVICRLDVSVPDNPSGYALLISGDGHYAIAALQNRSLNFLVEWQQSDQIRAGRAENRVRAVCVDDYLALYVNETFLGDVTDELYSQPGSLGVITGVQAGESVSVAFDNLIVYEGTLGGTP